MPNDPTVQRPTRVVTGTDALVLAAVLLVAGGVTWHELFNGWMAGDNGAMSQVAERVLAGQLPHRDFDDPWSGGYAFLQAALFRAFGASLAALRVPIFIAWLAGLVGAYAIARRLTGAWLAGLVTLAAATWSFYAYHQPLPNWYYTPLAIGAVWAAVRYSESRHRAWLLAAGVSTGIAMDIKITGLFLLAGLLLWTIAEAARVQPPNAAPNAAPIAAPDADAPYGFGIFAAVISSAYLTMVVLLVLRLPVRGAAYLHFALPNAAVALWVTARAARTGMTGGAGMTRLMRLVAPLFAGVVIAVAPLVIFYATQGALYDLWYGVFVRPTARFSSVWLPPPGRFATLAFALAPLVLLFGCRMARAMDPRRARMAVAAATILGAGTALLAHVSGDAMESMTITVRALPIVLALVALVWGAGANASAVSGSQLSLTVLLVAVSATGQLIQVPYADVPYVLYSAPLVILALVALLAWHRESFNGGVVFACVLLIGSGAGHTATNFLVQPADRWAPLPLARAGIFVTPADSARYDELARFVATRPAGPIHVIQDSPELSFLLGRAGATRVIYDVVADSGALTAGAVLPQLDRAGVMTVVITGHAFGFAGQLGAQVRALRRAFPHVKWVRDFEVRWRDSAAGATQPDSTPGRLPRDQQD